MAFRTRGGRYSRRYRAIETGATAVTDANGKYLFTGLTAGTYTVTVASGVPAGYTVNVDPKGPPMSNSYGHVGDESAKPHHRFWIQTRRHRHHRRFGV